MLYKATAVICLLPHMARMDAGTPHTTCGAPQWGGGAVLVHLISKGLSSLTLKELSKDCLYTAVPQYCLALKEKKQK